MLGLKVKNSSDSDSVDDLDHIVLKKRQRLLLERKLLGLVKPVRQVNSHGFSEEIVQNCAGRIKEEVCSVLEDFKEAENQSNETHENVSSVLSTTSVNSSSNHCALVSFTTNLHSQAFDCYPGATVVTHLSNDVKECDRTYSSQRSSMEQSSCDGKECSSLSMLNMSGSTLLTPAKVKVEPLDNKDMHGPKKDALSKISLNIQPVKSEPGISDQLKDSCSQPQTIWDKSRIVMMIQPVKSEIDMPDQFGGDKLDHMPLRDRMKLLASREHLESNISDQYKGTRNVIRSALEYSPVVPKVAKPIRINRSRKRKKTATDSVEAALKEDAPELLQVLIDKGVSVDEIKLYGEMESDETLDESLNQDSLTDLEAVISKLFFQRNSLLKFAPIQCTKGEKPSYCLDCLFSLVEQSRYLRFRKWPAEWGWCRELQSFIFVFERHNRIVLERPEYGFATYFFELVDSLSVDWQIKRLVIAMKLTNCGRINLIENKALTVGEDVSEGEAQVLVKYGWMPNTGLGTMLNYCDRVVHDRRNEKDSSEWRSKIGKLLMDGYNGGSIVSASTPRDIIDYGGFEKSPQIKQEQ
ncbi:uncharacterized protein LOC119998788 isoform X2 [Tripterygium wilfordii]|nr:uncharacterized protein LOC119998788 isoform X2 [Tripterygium wilfordii]